MLLQCRPAFPAPLWPLLQLTALTGLECLSLNYCRFDQPEERPLEVGLTEPSTAAAALPAAPSGWRAVIGTASQFCFLPAVLSQL